jgi:hypothetical protein
LVPVSAAVPGTDLEVIRVSTLRDAVLWAELVEPDTGRTLGVPRLRPIAVGDLRSGEREQPSK